MPPEQTAGAPDRGRGAASEGKRRRRHRRSWWRRLVRHAGERYRLRTMLFYCLALGASLVVAYGVTRCDLGTADSAPP
jgi:hypothetical protein